MSTKLTQKHKTNLVNIAGIVIVVTITIIINIHSPDTINFSDFNTLIIAEVSNPTNGVISRGVINRT